MAQDLLKRTLFLVALSAVLQGCVSENGVWAEINADPTEDAYLQFIERYPDGEHVVDAQRALEELRWQRTTADPTEDDYLQFIEHHPDGEHVADAQRALEELRWQRTTADPTEDAYLQFIEHHPDGEHVADAQRALEELREYKVLDSNVACSMSNFSYRTGRQGEIGGHIGSLRCILAGQGSRKTIPLASNELTDGEIVTQDFGVFKLLVERSRLSVSIMLTEIQQRQLNGFLAN